MGFFTEDESTENEFANIDKLDAEKAEADLKTVKPETKDEPKGDDQIPAKYRGKSVEDIIRMHQEAEGLIHRHSEEIGFAREMARKAAERLQSDNGSQGKRTDADQDDPDVEFFANPKKAVENTVANHPDVVAARQTVEEQKQAKALSRVKEAIGDPVAIMQDPEFATWLQENPFRIRTLQQANMTADADAAIEIFNNFKLNKEFKQAKVSKESNEVKGKQENAKRSMMVDSGTPAGPDTGTIYRASDLRKLQNRDPAKYERMEPQIMKAYAEKRVVFD